MHALNKEIQKNNYTYRQHLAETYPPSQHPTWDCHRDILVPYDRPLALEQMSDGLSLQTRFPLHFLPSEN